MLSSSDLSALRTLAQRMLAEATEAASMPNGITLGVACAAASASIICAVRIYEHFTKT